MSIMSFFKTLFGMAKSDVASKVEQQQTATDRILVDSIKVIDPFVFDLVDPGSVITLKKNANFRLEIRRFTQFGKGNKRWHKATMNVHFDAGFKTNGTSAPNAFNLQVPSYIAMNEKNADIYNAAAFIHDGLYACQGVIEEEGVPNSKNTKRRYTLSRKECDNILSEIWRKSKFVDSITAKIGELGVNLFAGGPDHWNNDDLGCKSAFSVKIKYK